MEETSKAFESADVINAAPKKTIQKYDSKWAFSLRSAPKLTETAKQVLWQPDSDVK